MRQLVIHVPPDARAEALDAAAAFDATNVAALDGSNGAEDLTVVMASVSNASVGPLIRRLEEIEGAQVTFQPSGVIPLHGPWDDLSDQAADPDPRSALEVYLGGLQSIGSWKGFLSYAALAGVIVWAALFLNVIFLQVAAMLIAPFAGPAMTTALATASGDATMLGRGIGRYLAAIAVTVATAAALHALLGTGTVTDDMVQTSKISTVAIAIPLAAGAAGALNLSQPERSSLVPGAATGVLVAAALAPPAGLLGMTAVMGEWDMARTSVFLLALQLLGINLTGAVVFRLFGLRPDTRLGNGRTAVVAIGLLVSGLGLAGLVWWQFSDPIELRRTTVERQAETIVEQVVDDEPGVALVRSEARFTRPDIANQDTLLVSVWVQAEAGQDRQAASEALSDEIARELAESLEAVPLVDVTVLAPPPVTSDSG